MPIVNIKGIGQVRFPDTMSQQAIIGAIENDIIPQHEARIKPAESMRESLVGGAKRGLSSIRTAISAPFDGGQEAGLAGLKRQEEIEEKPGASLDYLKYIHETQGPWAAAKELAAQTPRAIAEQVPNLAAMGAGAKAGAMAGARLPLPPQGRAIAGLLGGAAGAFGTSFGPLAGANIERQAQEGKQVDLASAYGTAIPQAGIDVATAALALGKGFGKMLGIDSRLLGTPQAEALAVQKLAQESKKMAFAKGTVKMAALEVPGEVIQQALERYQAGLPLTTPDAMKEYTDTAYQTALMGPIGGASRLAERSSAISKQEAKDFAEAEKAAQEEAAKAKAADEIERAKSYEDQAKADMAGFASAKNEMAEQDTKAKQVEMLLQTDQGTQHLKDNVAFYLPGKTIKDVVAMKKQMTDQATGVGVQGEMFAGPRGQLPTQEEEVPEVSTEGQGNLFTEKGKPAVGAMQVDPLVVNEDMLDTFGIAGKKVRADLTKYGDLTDPENVAEAKSILEGYAGKGNVEQMLAHLDAVDTEHKKLQAQQEQAQEDDQKATDTRSKQLQGQGKPTQEAFQQKAEQVRQKIQDFTDAEKRQPTQAEIDAMYADHYKEHGIYGQTNLFSEEIEPTSEVTPAKGEEWKNTNDKIMSLWKQGKYNEATTLAKSVMQTEDTNESEGQQATKDQRKLSFNKPRAVKRVEESVLPEATTPEKAVVSNKKAVGVPRGATNVGATGVVSSTGKKPSALKEAPPAPVTKVHQGAAGNFWDEESDVLYASLEKDTRKRVQEAYVDDNLSAETIDRLTALDKRNKSIAARANAKTEKVANKLAGDIFGAKEEKTKRKYTAKPESQKPGKVTITKPEPQSSQEGDTTKKGEATTTDEINKHISTLFTPQQLKDNPPVVVNTHEELPAHLQEAAKKSNSKAFVHEGKSYFIASAMRKGDERGTILHEIGAHLGLEKLIGKNRITNLANRVITWAAQVPVGKAKATNEHLIAKEALERANESGETPGSHRYNQEVIAYFTEIAVNKYKIDPLKGQPKEHGKVAGWLKELWASIVATLAKLHISPNKLKAADIVDLVYGAARIAGTGVKTEGEPLLASAKVDRMKATGSSKAWILFSEASKGINFANIKTLEQAEEAAEKHYKEQIKNIPEFDGKAYMEGLTIDDINAYNAYPQIQSAIKAYKEGNKAEGIQEIMDTVASQRKANLKEWKNYLENINPAMEKDPFWRDYVITSLLKSLRADKPDTGLILNANALGQVYEKFKQGNHVNFATAYKAKLVETTNDLVELGDETTGWRKIPQTDRNDPKFDKRVAAVQSLSCTGWCTRGDSVATDYIQRGDFWVYVDDKKPQVAIRFEGDEVHEIQGPQNTRAIPTKYIKEITSLVDSGKIKNMTGRTKGDITNAVRKSQFEAMIKEGLASGELVQSDRDYAKDNGIVVGREDKVYVDVDGGIVVDGDLTMNKGASVPKLTTVGGNASINRGANVPNLTTVGGHAGINEGGSAPALTTVGGDAHILRGASAPALTTVGGDAYIYAGASAPKLTTVGGNADISEGSSVRALTTVGGDARISEGASIPNLTTVGGDARIYEGGSVPALTTVGGNATIYSSAPALTTVGGDVFIDRGGSAPKLTTVGGYAGMYKGASAPSLRRKDIGKEAALKGTPLDPKIKPADAILSSIGESLNSKSSKDQPIHPTEAGIKNFWKWFGDSKATDKEGRPLLLYTGTSKDTDFSKFKVPRNGAWFTISASDASSYAVYNDSNMDKWVDGKVVPINRASRVIPVYLKITNPYITTGKDLNAKLFSAAKENYKKGQGIVFDELRQAGYDGVVLDGDTWIALNNPNQIKSAIGNTGEYATSNNAILSSIGESLNSLPSASPKLMEDARDALSTVPSTLRKAALRFYSLHNMISQYGGILPSIEKLQKAIAQRDNDNDARRSIVDKLTHKGVNLLKKYPKQIVRKFNKVAFELSIANVDPTKDENKDNELVKIYQTLPKPLQDLGNEYAAEYKKHFDEYIHILTEMAPEKMGRDYLSKVEAMRNDFESKGLAWYHPLRRQGDYWLTYTDKDGVSVTTSRESPRAIEREMKLARIKGATGLKQFAKLSQIEYDSKAPPSGFIADILAQMQRNGVKKEVINSTYQMYLSLLPSQSLRQQMQVRTGEKGYIEDVVQGFADVGSKMAHQLSSMKYRPDLDNAYAGIHNEAEKDASAAIKDVYEALMAGKSFIENPIATTLSSRLSWFSYFWHIAGNASSAFINLTQLPIIVLPLLAGRYGLGATTAAFNKAFKMYANGKFDDNRGFMPDFTFGKNPTLSQEYKDLYEAALDHSTIRRGVGYELTELRRTSAEDYTGMRSKIETGLGWIFQNSERMNREITLIAAYDLARAKMSPEDARAFAINTTVEAHSHALPEAGPQIFQNNLGKIAFTFKRFAQAQIALMAKLFYLTFKGETKEVRDIALRQMLGIYGTTYAFAGVQGMPLYGASTLLWSTAQAMFGDDEEPLDPDEQVKLAVGALHFKGPINQLIGLDIASRTGFNGLVWREEERRLAEVGPGAYIVEHFFGPSYSALVVNPGRALELFNQGHTDRALETLSPSFIRNPLKAYRFAKEGALNRKGAKIVDDVDGLQVFNQILGFTDAELSEAYGRAAVMKKVEQHMNTRRHSLLDAFYLANTNGDDEMKAKILENISSFNKAFPIKAITGETLVQSHKTRVNNLINSVDGVYIPPKLRATLLKYRDHENDEDYEDLL